MIVEIILAAAALAATGDLVERQARRRVLVAIAKRTGGIRVSRTSLRIDRGGYHATFTRTTRTFGSHQRLATVIDVALARPVPLVLYVRRRQRADRNAIQQGELVAIAFGEPVFDAKMIVEGAPESVVRAVLDEPTRSLLLAAHDAELTIKDVVSIAIEPALDDPDAAVHAVDLVVAIAERIRTAFADPDIEPYRPLVGARALEEQLVEQRAEVELVEQRRRARFSDHHIIVFSMVFGVIALILKVC